MNNRMGFQDLNNWFLLAVFIHFLQAVNPGYTIAILTKFSLSVCQISFRQVCSATVLC